MPPKKDKSLEEPSKPSKGSKAAPKTKATKASKAPKAPKTPAPAPAVQAPAVHTPAAAHPLNPERDVRRRTRANPSPGLSERQAIDKEPSFTRKRSNIRRTAAKNAAISREQDAEESTRTETPSTSHSPELEESRSTSPELAPQPSTSSRTPISFAAGSSSHQAAESLSKSARGKKRSRTQFDDSSDANTENVSTERREKRSRGDDQPFEHYSPIAAMNATTQVNDHVVQPTPQRFTIEHTEATPQTPTRLEENVGEQRPASALPVTNNDTSIYFTPQGTQAEKVLAAIPQHRESEVSAGAQPHSLALTPSNQGPVHATASSSKKSAAKSDAKPARRRLTMGPDLEHEAMMESLRRRQRERPMPKSVISRKTKPVEEVERLHISDASDSEDLEPLDAEGLRTIRENAKFTLANLAAEKQGKPKPYVWGPNPALQKKTTKTKDKTKNRTQSDAHTAAAPTQYPNDIKTAYDVEAACMLYMQSKRLAAATTVPSTDDNQVTVDQSVAGQSATSGPPTPGAEGSTPGDDLALESQTPPAGQAPGWSLMSTVKSVVSKPFEFFGGASEHAGPSNADYRSGSPSKTPTPGGRFRRFDPLKRRAALNKGKGKAPAVPLSKVNEFEKHSQNSRGKQREDVLESASDDELPHNMHTVPIDVYKQPVRVRRRDKAYYERKYAVPPIDPVTGNYVTARTFYAVPYPPSSDEESSSDEDFETHLPKGPRLYVMQLDKTEKEHIETEREKKERLAREAEAERKRLAEEAEAERKRLEEEAEREKERLEIEAEEDEDYLNNMPMDLDDLNKADPKWWLFKRHRFSELRMARRYEMNRSFPGQEYPRDKMKQYLAVYHERMGTVGAFTSGKEILTWEERAERRKHLPPPPPPARKPPGYIREPKVFGSAEMIKWAEDHKDRIHELLCKHGCRKCKRGIFAPAQEDKETEVSGETQASGSGSGSEPEVLFKAPEVPRDNEGPSHAPTPADKDAKRSAPEHNVSEVPQNTEHTSQKEDTSTKSSDMQSLSDVAGGKTPAKNTAPEAQTPTITHAPEDETPVFKTAQQLQLEAVRQQALKHQPQVPSKLGMSPLFQSPLQPAPLQSSPLQHNSPSPTPPQTNALKEIQPNQRQRNGPRFGGLMSIHRDGFTHDNDNSELDNMLEDDPNEPQFKVRDDVRNVPPKEVYFT
ncbi:hypothetical protein ONS95_005638 [Cadophora gregata]|uniref:uncharacterized protein n=1 Tax=Cadophora gregata TaxID=51156 RepID=UPI0026DA764A|nr:uncharacterized protein ONS95_005638 [Cadophora gregata]KAK0103626.1 hypothetical protein ONS95_005638 [Cadophora gregata]KAK0107820.1 hypothetical protein ONS96_003610 [Cadophora gregata f. sp. sojae]